MAAENPDPTVFALIFDSDILVWVLKRHPGAMQLVERVPLVDRRLSVISYLELLYGCRDQVQLRHLTLHIASKFGQVVPLSEAISDSATHLMKRFALSRRPDVNDVLIAATALEGDEPLTTANRKHFDFIPGLELRVFRP